MMGFGFLMMSVMIGMPLVGIIILIGRSIAQGNKTKYSL